jgi:hypothetical protein
MRRALALARKALGQTYPNPAVGCVIVAGGKVVGEGFHPQAGMPHAEVYALRAAGQAVRSLRAHSALQSGAGCRWRVSSGGGRGGSQSAGQWRRCGDTATGGDRCGGGVRGGGVF